jgi:antitoxin component YwqK of YwqJK toxin-antitoxin module
MEMFKLIPSFSLGILLFLSFDSCQRAQKKVISRFKNGVPFLIYEYANPNDTSNYIYQEFYPNAKIHEQLKVESNMVVNYPTRYYSSGKIYEIDTMLRPRERYSPSWDGWITRYGEDGKKLARFDVKNGGIHNTIVFDSNGRVMKEYAVVRNIVKEGPYSEFYPNGMISVKATFHNDTLNGMMYFFNENGDTDKYYFRDRGDISMPYKKWLDNGGILFGTFTGKDQKTVLWRWYSRNGREIKKEFKYSKDREFVVPE